MEIVKADNLVKYYGSGDSLVKAVDHVGLSVRKGEFVAVVGTSGSGNLTLQVSISSSNDSTSL